MELASVTESPLQKEVDPDGTMETVSDDVTVTVKLFDVMVVPERSSAVQLRMCVPMASPEIANTPFTEVPTVIPPSFKI